MITILEFLLITSLSCIVYLIYVLIKTIIQTKKINKNKPWNKPFKF